MLLAVGRDITERLETERRLRRQSDEQAAVAALGERALRGVAPSDLAREAAERVGMALSAERVADRRAGRGRRGSRHGRRVGRRRGPAGRPAGRRRRDARPGPGRRRGRLERRDPHGRGGVRRDHGLRAHRRREEQRAFLVAVANVLATAYSRLRSEQRIRHQALHDPLTRLANRALCRDRLEHALAHAERSGSSAAVLYVDVDDFKRINDLYGHSAGDAVLVSLARRLASAVRPADTVARLGGDEFVVVCEDVDERVALGLGWRVAAAVQEPLEVGRHPAPDLRQRRDRARQRRRVRRREPRLQRRLRRLPREGGRPRERRDLRRAAAPQRRRPRAHRVRPGGRARPPRARARLPADRGARRRGERRAGGAAALAPRRDRGPAGARGVHLRRRGVRA